MALHTNRQKRLWGLVLVLGVLGLVGLLERSRTAGAPPVSRAPTNPSTPSVAEEPLVDLPATSSPDRFTVKWLYDKSLLILLSKQGVGAVAFTESIEKGVVYSFRFESRDGGTKRAGTGKVFERYKVKETSEDGTQTLENDGGQLIINAGRLQAEWSRFSSHAGWVYGSAGNTEVGLVPLEPLENLDLRKAARLAVRELPEVPK